MKNPRHKIALQCSVEFVYGTKQPRWAVQKALEARILALSLPVYTDGPTYAIYHVKAVKVRRTLSPTT